MRFLTPVAAFFLVAAAFTIRSSWADYDIYWHLANGRLMVEQGRFPSPDRFSWSAAGGEYVAYSAQIDRAFYLLYRAGGARALGLYSGTAWVLALLPAVLLIGRLRPRPLVVAGALALLILATRPYVGARPHLVAFALLAWIAYLLELPFGRYKALAIGLALGAWANLHGTFYLGFAAVTVAAAAWWVWGERRAALWVAASLGGGFALSLLSPYRLRLWLHPLTTASNPYLEGNPDWRSLQPFTPTDIWMGALLLLALGLGVWRVGDVRGAVALALVLPAIHFSRFLPFVAPLLALKGVERLLERYPTLRGDAAPPNRAIAGASWVVLFGGVTLIAGLMPRTMAAAAMDPLPTRVIDRLVECGEPAPVWNEYDSGGYLIWRGRGAYTVGIDGRAETLYPNEVFADYRAVGRSSEGWRENVQRSPARYALVAPAVAERFDRLPGWRIGPRSGAGVLVLRDGAVWRCGEDRS